MKTNSALTCFAALCLLCVVPSPTSGQEPQFTTPTMDLGCVVSDIDKSIRFYTDAIGFKVSGGFQVPGPFCADAGLTDSKPLDVKVLSLGDGPGASKLKLMQVEGSGGKAPNDHIESTLGFSYLTIMIKSTDAAVARLKKAGVKTVAKSPIALPGSPSVMLTLVRDPDGNLIELVGPK